MESIVRGHAHRLSKNVRDHEIRSYGCSVCAFSRTRKWTFKKTRFPTEKRTKKQYISRVGSYHLVWSLFPEQHLRRNQVHRLSSSCIYLQPMSVLYLLGGLFPIKVFASHQGASRSLSGYQRTPRYRYLCCFFVASLQKPLKREEYQHSWLSWGNYQVDWIWIQH